MCTGLLHCTDRVHEWSLHTVAGFHIYYIYLINTTKPARLWHCFTACSSFRKHIIIQPSDIIIIGESALSTLSIALQGVGHIQNTWSRTLTKWFGLVVVFVWFEAMIVDGACQTLYSERQFVALNVSVCQSWLLPFDLDDWWVALYKLQGQASRCAWYYNSRIIVCV